MKGVTKGALTVEQAEAKFAAWEAEKAAKIEGKIDGLGKNAAADKAARMQAEADANAAKAKAIEVKNTPAVEDAPVEEVEAATEETATEEATEAPAAEEATEAPATEEGEA